MKSGGAEARAACRYMDAIRFLAAMAVVVTHARELVWMPRPGASLAWWSRAFVGVSEFNHQAVMIFFVLSGFWISHSVDRQLREGTFWLAFLTDRLTRLWIVIIPAVGFGALLDATGAGLLNGAAYSGGLGMAGLVHGVYPNLTPWTLAGNVLFLQTVVVPPAGTNAPLWSLTYEFWYYVWFAAIAVSIAKRRASRALAFLGLAAIWPSVLYSFPVWMLGSLIYYADRARRARPEPRLWRARTMLAIGLLALAAALEFARPGHGIVQRLISDMLVGMAFSAVLWALLRGALPFPRWLAPFATYGANASFSLYVTHFPLLVFLLAAMDYETRRAPDLPTLGLIAALCLLALVAGWLFSRLTEANTARVRRWLKGTAPARLRYSAVHPPSIE